MSQKTVQRIHRIYGAALSLLLVAVGVLLAVGCVRIYQSGDSPFTRASVAKEFSRIALPVLLAVVGVIGGGVLSLVWPVEGKRPLSVRERSTILGKLTAPYDMTTAPAPYGAQLQREQRFRRVMIAVAVALCLVAAFPAIAYCADADHFNGADKTADIRAASIVVLSSAAVGLFDCVAVVYACDRSLERETVYAKRAIAKKAVARKEKQLVESTARGTVLLWSVRGVILAVAVVFIILGVQNGGMADVLGKAIRICTECIGLG